jgi:thioredoxin-related protein
MDRWLVELRYNRSMFTGREVTMRLKALLCLALFSAGLGTAAAGGIEWHEGDVQSAFDLAKKEDRPLFLYWGAVWCPPCNQLKKTIFSQREFIEKTRLFVFFNDTATTESAQTWSDRLDVSGYPTMLVMNPDGHEVMRLPTGLQLDEFLLVLDDALEQTEPIAEVLGAALSDAPGDVSEQTYRSLAFHSWGQDRRLEMSDAEKEEAFRKLAKRVPDDLEVVGSRLFTNWLVAAAGRARSDEEFELGKKQRRQADARLREILESKELATANLEFITYYPTDVIPLLHPKNPGGELKLEQAWLAALQRAENDASLSVRERLSILMPVVNLHERRYDDEEELDPALVERVRARVKWADETAKDAYTRQSALSTAGYLLRRAGLDAEARQLYLDEVEKSESPYYFMSSLASMAEEAGDAEDAVAWMKRAYEESEGRATRVQWGVGYLQGLMRVMPEDAARVRSESLRVFNELLGFDDAFAGRNQMRIDRLASQFAKWNEEHDGGATISSLRTELLPACDSLSDAVLENDESLSSRCTEFFTGLGATASE